MWILLFIEAEANVAENENFPLLHAATMSYNLLIITTAD